MRAASADDVELVWSASRIQGFNDGMVWDPPQTREELISIAKDNLDRWVEGTAYTFTVDLVETHKAIGRVGIRREDNPSLWNIGFWIHPDHWQCGYATEATRVVIDFGFNTLGASRITTAHAVWNKASKRVIEKLGFRFTCENPCGFEKQGKPVAEYEYAIEKDAL
ncbi:MAG: GNAT family N-acetyltransferase [Gammaproteobacteria bacterium]